MKLGAVYPQIELGGDPKAISRLGAALEALGYDHLLAYDHVLGAVHDHREPPLNGPYTEVDPFHDPLVMFAYLAGQTERIELATGILVLPQRQTALVARQAADVSLLSGGRLRLGVGVGWNHVEYTALGQDFRTRGARIAEQVELLRRLWTEPVVTFVGEHHNVDRAGTLPLPAAPIPVWMGGFSQRAFDRASILADGFIFSGRRGAVVDQWAALQRQIEDAGRDVSSFGAERTIRLHEGAAVVAAEAWAWAESGGTHVSIVSMGLGLDSVEAHIDYFGAVAEQVRAQ